jgi:exopolyphosphatase/guanosine-5'-triphosphate,3'-diphosphate pyrophosphatase
LSFRAKPTDLSSEPTGGVQFERRPFTFNGLSPQSPKEPTLNSQGDNDIAAAFDIGSNTIKMTVGHRAPGGVEEIAWRSETVRLGQGVDRTGELAPDRMAAALAALREFSQVARDQGATRLIGVATEATRSARNGQAFLDRVEAETGIELSAISGAREAELTFLGLDGVVDLSGRVAIADIGGGSTEIIFAEDRRITFAKSFPIGSGRLTEQFVSHDPPTGQELESARAAAAATLVDAPFEATRGGRLYLTGGTGEYSFRMVPAGERVNASAFDDLLTFIRHIPSIELAQALGIAKARARVLPAGIAAARAVIELVQPGEVRAAQSGIRRGLLLALFAEPSSDRQNP